MKNAGRKVSGYLSNLLQRRGTKAYGIAWRAIRRRGPAFNSDANVCFLIQALRHADSHVVRDAARALTEIGAGASQPVLDAVARLLCDGDSRRRMAAASALQALPDGVGGSKAVADTLLSRLGDPDPGCRRDAVRALGALTVAGRPISEALRDRLAPLLADSDAEVAYASVNAVVAMGPPVLTRPRIRKALMQLLRYPNPHIVSAAASAE